MQLFNFIQLCLLQIMRELRDNYFYHSFGMFESVKKCELINLDNNSIPDLNI